MSYALPFGGIAAHLGMKRPGFKTLTTVMIGIVFALGALQFSSGLYIQAKARLAQLLIAHAWQRTLDGEQHARPWPWADTWPVARLVVPDLQTDLYVLAGSNGRAIAFGPGHVFGTPLPGEIGNSVIGGHRDTHLAFLRYAVPGVEMSIQLADGRWTRYRVEETEVVDKADVWVTENIGPTRLTLITCYPFDALRAGGSDRFVVTAMKI
jgi:sortase A